MSERVLGIRSPLVLSKIGFDMRPLYDDVIAAPLPEGLQSLTDELQGYAEWRDVTPADTSSGSGQDGNRSPDNLPTAQAENDEAFRFGGS